jgi:hypothetical protein
LRLLEEAVERDVVRVPYPLIAKKMSIIAAFILYGLVNILIFKTDGSIGIYNIAISPIVNKFVNSVK